MDMNERLARVELQLENVTTDLAEVKKDVKQAVTQLNKAVTDLRIALVQQAATGAAAVARPLDKFTGVKLALVGLGSLVVFVVTVIGGILGIVGFFHK